jgi:hypothetical protein
MATKFKPDDVFSGPRSDAPGGQAPAVGELADTDDVLPGNVDEPLPTSAMQAAIWMYQDAQAEADLWHDRCVRWTEAHGRHVWREGHPLDSEKLYWRREWRRRAAVCRDSLRYILEGYQPEGHA